MGEINSGAAGYFMSKEVLFLVLTSCAAPPTKWDEGQPCTDREIYHMYPPGRVEGNDFDGWAYERHPRDSVAIRINKKLALTQKDFRVSISDQIHVLVI